MLALAMMLLPLVAIAAIGVVTFSASAASLREFQKETVDESAAIERTRDLLGQADDLGEAYVENDDAAIGAEFLALSRRIDSEFDGLRDLGRDHHDLASGARARWEEAANDLNTAASEPSGERTDNALDPFHDHLDEAGELLADLGAQNGTEVADAIAAIRWREQAQLVAALTTLIVGAAVAIGLARRLRRSIAVPLLSLEDAAAKFGSDELSYRVDVSSDDELGRVGNAFNTMASRLETSRADLRHLALHDPLTGLPNRALFVERMEQAIARARRRDSPFSVLYVDLDLFKGVNDTLGHDAGDKVLVAVANRITESLRAEDTAARLGGDEFGVLVGDGTLDTAVKVAERLSRALTCSVATAFGEVPVRASIGVAVRQDDEELDELLRQADTAMYAAKTHGAGGWQVFGADTKDARSEATTVRVGIEHALERRELVVHYQPVVNLHTGAIYGLEALVRWDHPVRGLLPPSEFLEDARESGQMLALDNWVLDTACRQVRQWQETSPGQAGLRAFVNLSAARLQHPGLADAIERALRSSGLRPRDLVIELTETAPVQDVERVAVELRKLKELGVTLALDDFGTGYSSLSHLMRFPVDMIKIDRLLVADISTPGSRSGLASALVRLGDSMGLQTVAEGIEEQEELDTLRIVGCKLGQGYYFSRPLPSEQIAALFARSASDHLVVLSG